MNNNILNQEPPVIALLNQETPTGSNIVIKQGDAALIVLVVLASFGWTSNFAGNIRKDLGGMQSRIDRRFDSMLYALHPDIVEPSDIEHYTTNW